jgi:hypothetical protein
MHRYKGLEQSAIQSEATLLWNVFRRSEDRSAVRKRDRQKSSADRGATSVLTET